MSLIQVTAKDGIAEVVLTRPKVNALNQALLQGMREAFEGLARDDEVHGALLVGGGSCLSAGLDLREVASLDRAGLSSFMDDFDAAFTAVFAFPKPLAVAVHGHAIAGGLVLAMCGDYTAFGVGEYKVGLTELAVGVPLPRVALEIVRSAAPAAGVRRLVYGAALHSAAEVLAMGVGDTLCADPHGDARSWLSTTCRRPAATFRLIKAMLRKEAWERVANRSVAERQALLDAMLAAKAAMIAPLPSRDPKATPG